jgi:tyrosinase
VRRFTSDPLDLPPVEEGRRWTRADLLVYGVDHRGASYEVRAFLDRPEADHTTPLALDDGYAGCFTVFGHGGCFGDPGHCDPEDRHTDEFDLRPPNRVTPQTKLVLVTEALRRVQAPTTSVTLVCVRPGDGDEPEPSDEMGFSSLRILTYE